MSDPSEAVDERVLQLRDQGQAYARISRDLGLDRTADAQQAFRRALRRLPAPEAARVRGEELTRLDRLADRVRGDTARNDVDRARQLKRIDRMRDRIRDDSPAVSADGGTLQLGPPGTVELRSAQIERT